MLWAALRKQRPLPVNYFGAPGRRRKESHKSRPAMFLLRPRAFQNDCAGLYATLTAPTGRGRNTKCRNRGTARKLLTARADHSGGEKGAVMGDMVNNDLAKPLAPPKHRRTFSEITAMIVGMFLVTAVVLIVIKIKYVDCFQAPLPSGTNIGHFERCVLGIEAADENGQPIPWR